MNILKYRLVWYVFSGFVIFASIAMLGRFGLKQGIDFTGGTQLAVRFDQRPSPVEAARALEKLDLGSITVQPVGEKDMSFRLKTLDDVQHQGVVKALDDGFGQVTELEYTAIGPAIGQELRQKSVRALALIFLAVLAFIAWQFRGVSTPMKSWKYGVVVVLTAVHDVIVPLGLFALLGVLSDQEVGTPFIAAILTIMGYSINDTIVVFDRIRENLRTGNGPFEEVVGRSLRQTMLRSVYTSVTTLLSLVAVYLFGGESIKEFALALIVGIVTGTYSSIFIAAPLLVTWYRFDQRRV